MTQAKAGTKKPKRKRKKKAAVKKVKRGYTHPDALMKDNGWFELIDYFDPTRARKLTMKEDKKQRVFLLGALNETAIVQVPKGVSDESIRSLQTMLEDSGIKAIIMGDDVRWSRFRRCSPDEEEVLDGSSNEEETQSLSVPWPPPGDDGAEDTDSERAQPSESES